MKNAFSVKKKNKLGKRQNLLNRPPPTSPSSLSSTTSSGSEPEKTTIVYGEKKVLEKVLQFASGAGTEIKACIDQSRPLLAIEIPSLKRAFMDAKKRGVRLEYVTEITNKKISYCKKLIDIITELRHLEGIKGNFYVSDSGYLASALFHEEGRVAAQAIYSNGKKLVKHQRYELILFGVKRFLPDRR
jgi:hypothetical protein